MTKDLINRLRHLHYLDPLMNEAADALERLTTTTVELPEPDHSSLIFVAFRTGMSPVAHYYNEAQLRDYGAKCAAAVVRDSLTEEQIIDMNDDACEKYITQDGRGMALARAIEAAHGIRDGGGV